MRICFVAYDGANCLNGPNVNLRRLLPMLAQRGHEVSCLIIHRGATPLGKYLQTQNVEIRSIFWRGYTQRHINWLLEQTQILQPEIFVPNSSVPAFFAARAVRESGAATIGVLRAHDEFHRVMLQQFGAVNEWQLSGLVCVDGALQQQTRDFNAQMPTIVVPSGVPIPQHSAIQNGPLRIAYIGRLEQEQKRILEVVRGLCAVLKNQSDATATLFGSGPEQSAVQKIIVQNGLQSRLHLAGSVAPEQLHSRLIEFNTVLLMSDYEGTPGALMDGMACGLVPVALDIQGGVRDLVLPHRTGILLQSRDELVGALQTLRDDDALRKQLSNGAREHIRVHFSLESAADKWEEFSRELLGRTARAVKVSDWQTWQLPPVQPAMAREDVRLPASPAKIWRADTIRQARRVAGKLKRAFQKS